MPQGASASGQAFELLSSAYLSVHAGLSHEAAPFYTRVPRGKWVQFDGLFLRGDGARLILEAKFYHGAITQKTPGIGVRISFAKELGADGIVLTARRGFGRDLMQLKLPIEKILLTWRGMRRHLRSGGAGGFLTATLDEIALVRGGLRAASGAVLKADLSSCGVASDDGFLFVPVMMERWARRLSAAPDDIDPAALPAPVRLTGALSIEEAWAVEDSLVGFAPAAAELLVLILDELKEGPLALDDLRRRMWRRGHRGRKSALRDGLRSLSAIKTVERFRAARGVFYGIVPAAAANDVHKMLEKALQLWPAYRHFQKKAGGVADKYELARILSADFAPFFPYARSLYNPAKVAGLLTLRRYFAPSEKSTKPS